MKKRLYQLTATLLCLALVWTAGDAAQTIDLIKNSWTVNLQLPHVVRPDSDPSYFTQQAIVQRLVSPHFARISLGALYRNLPRAASVGKFLIGKQLWVNLATPIAFVAAFMSTLPAVSPATSALLTQLSALDATTILFQTVLWTLVAHGIYLGILKAIYGGRLNVIPDGALCGVGGYSVQLAPEQTEIPLLANPIPEDVADLSLAQGEVTAKRGRHEAGAVIRVEYEENGRSHYKFIIVKVVSPKREDLPILLEEKIRRATTLAHLRDRGIHFPGRLVVITHFRYSTSSDPSIEEEAHPHVGEVARPATMYTFENLCGQSPLVRFRSTVVYRFENRSFGNSSHKYDALHIAHPGVEASKIENDLTFTFYKSLSQSHRSLLVALLGGFSKPTT